MFHKIYNINLKHMHRSMLYSYIHQTEIFHTLNFMEIIIIGYFLITFCQVAQTVDKNSPISYNISSINNTISIFVESIK